MNSIWMKLALNGKYKQTSDESQEKRQKTVNRLRSKSRDCGFSAYSVERLHEDWKEEFGYPYPRGKYKIKYSRD